MISSSIFMGEHENSICGYKGPTMFDLGLLRTLGQVLVSLGTSQVHWHFYGLIWTLKYFGFCLGQFGTDLV